MLNDIEKVKQLNPHAISVTGELKPIALQYADYSYVKEHIGAREASAYLPLIVALNCSIYDVPELAEKPLVLFNHSIRHIEKKHAASIEDIISLASDLANNLLVFQDPYKNDKYIFVLQLIDDVGNRYIAALNANIEHNAIEINSVASVHKKEELFEQINTAIEKNKHIYVNERTGDWLNSSKEWEPTDESRVSLTKAVHNHLLQLYNKTFSLPIQEQIAPVPEGMTEIKPGEAVPQQPSQAPVTPSQNNEAARKSAQAQGRTASQPNQDINKKR